MGDEGKGLKQKSIGMRTLQFRPEASERIMDLKLGSLKLAYLL